MYQQRKANPKKHPSTRRKTQDPTSPAQFFKNICKSFLITLAAAAALLFVSALAAYFSPDPNRLILPLGLLSAALSALIGGFAAIRLQKQGALLCGLSNAALLLGLMLILSLFLRPYAKGYSPLINTLMHLAIPFLSVLGASLGRRRDKLKKRF